MCSKSEKSKTPSWNRGLVEGREEVSPLFVLSTSQMMIMMAVGLSLGRSAGRRRLDLGLRASAQKLPFMLRSLIHSNTFPLFSLAESRDLTMGEVAIFHFLKPKRTNLAMKQ